MPAREGARKALWISADSSSSPQALRGGGVELRGKVSSARHQDGFVKLHRLHRTPLCQGRGWLALRSTWRMATHPPWWSRLPSWHQTTDNRQIITEDIRMRHENVAKLSKASAPKSNWHIKCKLRCQFGLNVQPSLSDPSNYPKRILFIVNPPCLATADQCVPWQ